MIKRRVQILMILASIILLTSGCASFKEKFIRKPKEEEETARRYQVVRTYDVHPSLELYTKRYIYWKNWQREFLDVLMDDNHKKIVVAAEQSVSNLYDMKRMLVDDKGDQLQKFIDEMTEIEQTVKKHKVTQGNRVRLRRKIESVGRQVKKNFSYTKIRGFIRDDFREQQYSDQ